MNVLPLVPMYAVTIRIMTQKPLVIVTLSRTMGFATFIAHTLDLIFEEIFSTILVEGFSCGEPTPTVITSDDGLSG